MKRVVINIRATKNISGLVKVSVTSPAGVMKFFLNVEPCGGGGNFNSSIGSKTLWLKLLQVPRVSLIPRLQVHKTCLQSQGFLLCLDCKYTKDSNSSLVIAPLTH